MGYGYDSDVDLDKGRVTLQRAEAREDIPSPGEVGHPFWYEPVQPGSELSIRGTVDGIPWTAKVAAGKSGWSHIIGFALGTFGDHDLVTAVTNMADTPFAIQPTPPPLADVYERAAAEAEAQLRSIEVTRQVMQIISDEVFTGIVPTDLGQPVERTKSHEVEIAAQVYRLVVANMTRPKPIPFIAAYLACSERTAGSRVALARERGLLGEAKVGYANTQDKKKAKKSGGKK